MCTLMERMDADGIAILERNDEPACTALKCLDPDGHRSEVYWEPPLSHHEGESRGQRSVERRARVTAVSRDNGQLVPMTCRGFTWERESRPCYARSRRVRRRAKSLLK